MNQLELTTLCYIEKEEQYLMLHRVKKENDINEGKWIGVGGHLKPGETVDECVGKIYDAIMKANGTMFICADHGNADMMIDYETGEPWTAHTTNPVPFILVNYDPAYTLKEDGCLADIIPTLIECMGEEQPAEMTGKSLLVKKD